MASFQQNVEPLIESKKWRDEYLSWENMEDYNLTKIWIPARNIWRPDLIITNYANGEYSEYMNTNAMVDRDGSVLWMFPIVVKMYCTLDVKYFPFDVQECNMTMLSWTYNGYQIDLKPEINGNKVYYNPINQEWDVTAITPHLQVKKYTCCVEPFPEITFTIHMHRRCLFYLVNLICPCILIYLVSFLGFFLPVESGEKVNLEITVLLALVVFLLMVSETMPPTPDAIPIVGLLFAITMVMVSIGVVMAVVVTNVYFRSPREPLPYIARRLAAYYRRERNRALCAELNRMNGMGNLRRVKLDLVSLDSVEHCIIGQSRQSMGGGGGGKDARVGGGLAPMAANGNQSNGEVAGRVWQTAESNRAATTTATEGIGGNNEEGNGSSTISDWHYVAFMLDRIFFWMFFVMTITMFSAVVIVSYPALRDNFSLVSSVRHH